MLAEEACDVLAARRYGYLLFQRLLGAEPSVELFEAIDLEVAEEAFALVLGGSFEALERGMGLLRSIREAACALSSLRSDYMRLFVGPASLPAPPWESVYVSGKRELMQVSTLEVRSAYRAQGVAPAMHPHVPDDHIALELDFLATLAQRSCEADRPEAIGEALEASKRFVERHVGRWVNEYAHDMAAKGGSAFYAQAAAALASFVAADARVLDDLLAYNVSRTR